MRDQIRVVGRLLVMVILALASGSLSSASARAEDVQSSQGGYKVQKKFECRPGAELKAEVGFDTYYVHWINDDCLCTWKTDSNVSWLKQRAKEYVTALIEGDEAARTKVEEEVRRGYVQDFSPQQDTLEGTWACYSLSELRRSIE